MVKIKVFKNADLCLMPSLVWDFLYRSKNDDIQKRLVVCGFGTIFRHERMRL